MRRNAAALIVFAILAATAIRAPELGAGGVFALLLAALAAFYAVSPYDSVIEQRLAYATLAGEVRALLREIAERDAATAVRASRRLAERQLEAGAPRRAEEFVLDAIARDARR